MTHVRMYAGALVNRARAMRREVCLREASARRDDPADHSEAYYPYQKDISLRLADAKDPEGSLTGRVMLKADPADDVCEYADDFEVAPLPEANEALNEIGLPTIPTKYTLVKVRI